MIEDRIGDLGVDFQTLVYEIAEQIQGSERESDFANARQKGVADFYVDVRLVGRHKPQDEGLAAPVEEILSKA